MQKALELDPNNASALWWMALSHEQKRELSKAVTELEKAVSLSGEGTLSRGLLANAYALAGETGKALTVLAELKELSRKRYVSPVDFAVVYTGLGDRNSAFQWLERRIGNARCGFRNCRRRSSTITPRPAFQ